MDLYSFANTYELANKDSLLSNLHIYSIDYLISISKENKIHDFDSAELILLSADHLADSLRETDHQIKALILLGHLYFDNGYFENAEEIFNRIIKDFSSELTDEQLADVNHSLGLNHIRFNNYDKAINLFQEALLFYEKTDNKEGIAKALKDIGQVYYYLGNENTALDNYQKALLIYREVNDSDGIARTYNNIGIIFKEKGNVKQALDYLNQSLEIKKKQKNAYGIANTLGNMGDAYMANGEYDKAIRFFIQALEMWVELEYLHGITEVYNYLGKVYIKKGDYDKAILNLLESQKISLQNNFKQRLTVNSQLLSEAYFKIKDYQNAFLYLQKYNVLKDSLFESLSNQKIEEYLIKYENIKAENELIEQKQKIMQQRFQIVVIVFVLFGAIVFIILIIRQNRTIRKKSRKIQKINKELDSRVHKKTSELRISRFSIDIAVDAIIWMKRNGNIVYVNNAACLMLGYSKEELDKMSIFDLVSEFSEDIWQEYWLQLKNKRSYVIQLYYTTRMGSEIPVEVAFNFQEFEGEEFNFSYSRNITERKISEEKLKNAKDKAERSDKLKSAFLANMSHEIRTPMNAINGFINLLADPDIGVDQKDEIVEYAQSSSKDLLNIVNDIIDISRIEADELTVNKSLYYVNRLLSDIYKMYLKDIYFKDKEGLKLRLQVEPNGERIAVFTDRNRFKQIMNNLINNAIKFTEQGEIVIGYKQVKVGNRKLLSFFVKDTGIGIPEKKQEIIFTRFNQLADDRNKTFKGTGLGLAISKKLVDLLGGNIGVNSIEGQGSEFYFDLPYQVLDNPDENLDQESTNSKQKYNWGDKAILIVEDTPSNYYLVENYLRPTKLKLVWAKSGKEAIDLFKNNEKFDLILMDIQLPGINGYEATKLIKAYNDKIPVIAQTAYALSGEKDYSLKEGCDDYISKPIKKETLIELLTKYFQ
jgi:hypothetical protein